MQRQSLIIHILFLSTAFISSACGSNGDSPNTDNNINDNPITEIEEGFSYVTLTAQDTRVEPMTGIVFWSENNTALNALDDIVQLEFSYMLYSDIVETEGNYNWDMVDNLLNEIASRGHQTILRFRYTYPGDTTISVPDYIANADGYSLMISTIEGRQTFIPDWRFSGLESFTKQFFIDFAARYDGDPRLALLQIGFGSYAEYHLYNGNPNLGTNFPGKAFQETFLETLDTSFMTTKWGISIDAANAGYSPFASNPALLNLEFGLFDDSFMHEQHSENDSEYNRSSWLFFDSDSDRYQNNMMGGEFSYYTDYDQQNVLNLPDGAWGRSFESFAEQYKLSYIIGNDQFNYQSTERIEQASQSMGYKFHVSEFRISATESRFSITNKGIAPAYYDIYPSVNGVRSTESLKGLLPEEVQNFMISSTGTIDNPVFAIESDHLVDGQSIGFSVD